MQPETAQYRARERYQAEDVASQYDDRRFTNWYGRMAHQTEGKALRRMIDRYFPKPGSVLDAPCGTARLWDVLLDRGFLVTGVDISDQMLDIAQRRYQNNSKVQFKRADAENLPFPDNSFDYLTSYRLMCHLPQEVRRKVVGEMLRVTRHTAVINYHFASYAPLALFNRFFRKESYVTYPLTIAGLPEDFTGLNVEICEVYKLSWYERSSALVVVKKISNT